MKIKLILLVVISFPYIKFAQPAQEKKELNLLFGLNKVEKLNSFQNHRYVINSEVRNYPGFYHVITDVPMDFLDFGSSIFSKESIVPIVLLSTVTTGLIFYDHKSWEGTKKIVNRSNSLNSFTHAFVETGDAKWHLGLSGAALMFGYLTDDTRRVVDPPSRTGRAFSHPCSGSVGGPHDHRYHQEGRRRSRLRLHHRRGCEGVLLPSRRPRLLDGLRPPRRRRACRVRDRDEPQGPARDPGAIRLARSERPAPSGGSLRSTSLERGRLTRGCTAAEAPSEHRSGLPAARS